LGLFHVVGSRHAGVKILGGTGEIKAEGRRSAEEKEKIGRTRMLVQEGFQGAMSYFLNMEEAIEPVRPKKSCWRRIEAKGLAFNTFPVE